MSWVALVNPAAGRRTVDPDRIRHVLRRSEVTAEVLVIDGRSDMRSAVTEVASSGRDLIVVGGDGTVGLAVDALLSAGPIRMPRLGVLPAGTGCDLLRTFGIPQDLEVAAERLRGDGTYRIDVGRLSGTWGDRHFVNVAQAGVGAAAAETAPRLPRRLGPVRYQLAFAARLPRFPVAGVSLGGSKTLESRALAVIVANAQFFAGGWNIAPKALLVDGAFDVQVISARRRQAPGMVPKLMAGTHLALPEVWRRSMEHVVVETDVPWPVEADGDHLGMTPFEARVSVGAVELKV